MRSYEFITENTGNWYIRIRGKVLKDKQGKGDAIPYPSQDAAQFAALRYADKKHIAPAHIKLTQSWMDAPELNEDEFIKEADRIGTALWRNSIPKKYKQFPVIGQGATSVVLDKGDGNVLVLTRDAMKKDWLVQDWGLGLGEWIDGFDAHHQQSRELSEMPVFVIQMPKLFSLSLENKRKIKQAKDQFGYFVNLFGQEYRRQDDYNKYLEAHPDGLFVQLVEFLQNYDIKQYGMDFLTRNFMQDAEGNIVLIDPIVSKEIVDALHDIVQKKYNPQRRW
jgi:hypothetical protein